MYIILDDVKGKAWKCIKELCLSEAKASERNLFNMCIISQYQIHFLIGHLLGTCIPWPSQNSKRYSITTTFKLLNLTHRIWEGFFWQIYSIFQVKNVQIMHLFFLHRKHIYCSKRYILSKCLLIAAEVSVSFVLFIYGK